MQAVAAELSGCAGQFRCFLDSNRHDPIDDQATRSQKATFPDRLLRVHGLEKFVEIEIQQQLPGILPALHDGCGGQ